MEKFKGKNLILVCVAVVMSLFLLIQTSSAYFTGDDSVAGGDVAVPHITKTVYATPIGGSQVAVTEENGTLSFTATADTTYTFTVSITTNIPVLVRAELKEVNENGENFYEISYDSNWIANTNIYGKFYEVIPEESTYDSYRYYKQIVNASSSAQTLTIGSVDLINGEVITLTCSVVQANAYALTHMWVDGTPDNVDNLDNNYYETLVVYDGSLVLPNSDGSYTVSGTSGNTLELRFAYPYSHLFAYNSTTSTGDVSITLSSSTTYNITLTILENIVINYTITVQVS